MTTSTSKIRATVRTVSFRGGHVHDVDCGVLNPGEYWGKTYLLIANSGFTNLIIEADNEQDAIDLLADNDEYGHIINLDDDELTDHLEDYNGDIEAALAAGAIDLAGNDGHAVDLSGIQVLARYENVVYHGDSLPPEGVKANHYRGDDFDREEYAALNWLDRNKSGMKPIGIPADIPLMADDILHGDRDVCGILADRLDDLAPDGSLGMVSAGLRKLPDNKWF